MTSTPPSQNAIVFAPAGRDARVAAQVLAEAGIASEIAASAREFLDALRRGAGFALATEEALRDADPRDLASFVRGQPEWSDFPFILLTDQGGGLERNPLAARLLEILGNVTFLERPFHPTTLVSLSRSALRARQRQYEARGRLEVIRLGEERLRIAMAAGSLGAWTLDLPEATLQASDACKAHYGRGPADSFDYGDLWASIHSDDRAYVRESMRRVLEDGDDYDVEYRCVWPDGAVHWVQVRGGIDSSRGSTRRMAGVSLDVTERKRAEADLLHSEARFRAAVSAVQGVLWTNSADGRMIGDQPGWARLTGQTREQYEGFGWAAAVHPDDAQATIDAWALAVAERRAFEFEHRVKRRDGAWGNFSIRAVPAFETDGSIREWVGVHTDITDQRAAERELAEFAANLEQRVLEATLELAASQESLRQSQKLETLGQLTGGVAHDFNNLLTPIVGSLDVLKSKLPGDERAQRMADAGLQSAERAKTLVNRLLAFARRQTLDPRPIDVPALIEGMRDLIERSIGPAIAVEVSLAPRLPPALADPNQLELSILNLALNARDAMEEGGALRISVVLDEGAGEPRPDGLSGAAYLKLTVGDSGVGMDEETARRAIEPFYTTKGIGKGTGLGLSMVHGLTAQLGGGMAIDTAPGEGTRISLWLPLADRAVEAPKTTPDAGWQPPAAPATVLLVDDEDLVRFATADMLREAGYAVVEAASAELALGLVRGGLSPDVLVTDQLMPGMRGSALATELRGNVPGLRVLLATGYSDLPETSFPRIAKPFGGAELVRRVRALVESAD